MENNREKINYEEYNKTLEVLSYDTIVDTLCKEDAQYMITFSEFTDFFGNKKTYQYVTVRNLSIDKWKTYLAADQDPDLIERNLDAALGKVPENKEVKHGYIDNDWACQYHAQIGKNWVVYPPAVAKKLIKEFKESSKRQKAFEEEQQKEITKSSKKKILDPGEDPFNI